MYLVPEPDRFKAGSAYTAVEATGRGNLAYVAFRRVFGRAGGADRGTRHGRARAA